MSYEQFVTSIFSLAEKALKSIHEERREPLPQWLIEKHAAEMDTAEKEMDATR